MSLIKIENLTFSYYGYVKPVFENVSFSFDTNWKTGLIGRNGIGKSTLFKLLLKQEVYQGKISSSVDFVKFPPDIRNPSQLVIALYQELLPDEADWKLCRELNLLHLDENLIYRAFDTLSKGEQTKILLAMLFTKDDGFLLIDEPTNHLDLEGRQVVSDYLKSKKGFLLISHDRNFLDGCINHVIALNRNSIDVQSGNFTSWYDNKTLKDRFELGQNEKLQKDIKRLKDAARQSQMWSDKIETTKNGMKVSGVKPDKGRIGHRSAKMMKKSKNLEHRQHKAIEEKQRLLKDIDAKESLLLHPLAHHKNPLLSVRDVAAYYGDVQLFSHLSFEINQGDIAAIYGGNGSGKSTLIKILLGLHHDYTGELHLASGLKISYIPQAASDLTGRLNEYIHQHNVDDTLCKTILSKLDFSKALFDMDMQHYSDGQKKKVLLAVSLSKPAHVFIWDEPLNYIDVISRIQIEEMIKAATPTLIFVEHDKRFADELANKIIQV
ncbi:Lsa family ABC-F type ribosomal protection protein [Peptoniphilus equinus]|uniref:Lsa family ABC-F type ribosomal protection protein n=1 Tax=Peptoniphilus equinus TaxID=3016343 RepID=A0ABY7QVW2_9FIRM|nr:Lsa family ABC-F type ribosomal protection protein [Peptoniphilus equinus]WBW50053.1 Lsa family ABC-F type ribosomal protection protein [Peptoniphilus equinus]